jgi:ATP-dependent DNA helicase DinG
MPRPAPPSPSPSSDINPATRVRLPAAPILAAGLSEAVWVGADGEVLHLDLDAAAARARADAPLLCHARANARRLGLPGFAAFDVLELFAFARPASFCVPTPRGLAEALGLAPPADLAGAARALREAAVRLLAELAAADPRRTREAAAVTRTMGAAEWPWAPFVLSALGTFQAERGGPAGLNVWDRLPAWSDQAPPPPPGHEPVSPAEARTRLAALLGDAAEARPQQADYASAVALAFAPREAPDAPNVVLAEAGTGVGKTAGYIAPASVWAEKNKGAVWLSTFTRNLQHQIDTELDRLYPTPAEKAERVVVRKGRENYLCLLNLEDSVRALPARPGEAVAVGLMARWTARTRDGDMVGGDFPGWLADLLGRGRTLGLTDRRGECIYAACPHYGRCFIERGIRRARHARIVVANHALVMIQAALGGEAGDDGGLPTRYVFDEGHHVFAAADSAFAAHLSGLEAHALRRWLVGAERGRGGAGGASRIRGLRRRTEDLIAGDAEMEALLDSVLRAARALPGDGWHQRLAQGDSVGATEAFLAAVRTQVYARARGADSPYSLETDLRPPAPELETAARDLAEALRRLQEPLGQFQAGLARRLDDDAAHLDSDARRRIEATCRGIERRGVMQLGAWRAMLAAIETETPPEFVDWLAVERADGRDQDVGLYRHWIDPTIPFATAVLSPAHGAVITSATLTDGGDDPEADWAAAEARVGATHLASPAVRARVPSPFDYAGQTRIFVVNDLRKDNMDLVAAGYRELFLAAGGGGLGLFTAISRLRAVHGRIGAALEAAGLNLYAQHVDPMDTATLVDIFRAEEDSCLLGTDAVRDGVDVPGRALRLIVFDRVPWPRPDIAHRARRGLFGGRAYDDRLTRLRLKQAFGRLVRRADDRGVFVLLDPMMPSRLAGAFPPGVEVRRVGLAEAARETSAFLGRTAAP